MGAAAALGLLVAAAVWLVVRRQFTTSTLSSEEAGRLMVRAGHIGPTVGARFANARGSEWTAHLSQERLRVMVRAGQWREAAPWLLLAAGVVIAFPFWPFFLLQLVGLPGPLAGLAALVLLVILVRTLRTSSGR